MHVFHTKDVERILGLPRGAAAALPRRGLLSPQRGRGREYQFSFQDLIVLRVARSLAASRVPLQRIHRSLARLRRQLPSSIPLSGLSISAIGEQIIVREGAAYWETQSGQYVMQFDVMANGTALRIVDAPPAPLAAPVATSAAKVAQRTSLFEEALELEHDVDAAIAAYRRCHETDPQCIEARINCGRLLHAQGSLQAAEQMYLGSGREQHATLLFNLAVLLEDLKRPEEARGAYYAALAADSQLADAHYNLAILSERRGLECEALRHLNRYRQLLRR